jgi:putative transposase
MDSALVTDILKEALEKYPAPQIFNSDQGSQYTGHEHTGILKENNIQLVASFNIQFPKKLHF